MSISRKNEQLDTEREEWKSAKDLTADNGRLHGELAKVLRENDSLREQLAAEQQKLNRAMDEVRHLIKLNEQRYGENQQLRDQLAAERAKFDNMMTAISHGLQKQLKRFNTTHPKPEVCKELERMRRELALPEIQQLREQLAAERELRGQAENRFNAVTSGEDILQTQIERDLLRADRDDKAREIQQLREQLAAAKKNSTYQALGEKVQEIGKLKQQLRERKRSIRPSG